MMTNHDKSFGVTLVARVILGVTLCPGITLGVTLFPGIILGIILGANERTDYDSTLLVTKMTPTAPLSSPLPIIGHTFLLEPHGDGEILRESVEGCDPFDSLDPHQQS